jgi:hypothetical protein
MGFIFGVGVSGDCRLNVRFRERCLLRGGESVPCSGEVSVYCSICSAEVIGFDVSLDVMEFPLSAAVSSVTKGDNQSE